jgi:hypothetical protein
MLSSPVLLAIHLFSFLSYKKTKRNNSHKARLTHSEKCPHNIFTPAKHKNETLLFSFNAVALEGASATFSNDIQSENNKQQSCL